MPNYTYICLDCLEKAGIDWSSAQLGDEGVMECVYETKHSFDPTPEEKVEAVKCPSCESSNSERVFVPGDVPYGRIRNSKNWAEFRRDNQGALSRDMALHQLQTDDPYAHMREADDKDELQQKLRDGGKKDKNTDKKNFIISNPDKPSA